MKKLLISLLIIICIVSILFIGTGCKVKTATTEEVSATEAGGVTAINFWTDAGQTDKWPRSFISDFENKNPNIKIIVSTQNEENLKDILRPSIASGKEKLDMSFWWATPGWTGVLAKDGLLADLTPLYEKYKWSDFLVDTSGYKVNNKYYSLTTDWWAFPFVFYNKEIFNKVGVAVPNNINEFFDISKKILDAGYIPMVAGNKDKWPVNAIWCNILLRVIGVEKQNKYYKSAWPGGDSSVNWTDPSVVESFKILKELVDNKVFQDGVNSIDDTAALSMFANGKAAMWMSGTWGPDMIKGAGKIDFDVFNFPIIKDNIPMALIVSPSNAVVVPKYAENKLDAIGKFLDYYVSKEAQIKAFENGLISARTDWTAEELNGKVDPIVLEITNFAKKYPAVDLNEQAVSPEFNAAELTNVQQVLDGSVTPEQASANLEKAASDIRKQ